MVRERVNQEISKQYKLGKTKLPPLQPPGSLDGMEMFGFSSPAIVQVILFSFSFLRYQNEKKNNYHSAICQKIIILFTQSFCYAISSGLCTQVIQAMDQNRVCVEYWKSRPLMQIPANCGVKLEQSNNQQIAKKESIPAAGVDKIIDGLFKKVNPEELNVLYSILSNHNSTAGQDLVIRLLKEEIGRRAR